MSEVIMGESSMRSSGMMRSVELTPIDQKDLAMMSAAKDVSRNNGVGMWLKTQGLKIITLGSEKYQNLRALDVANQVIQEFGDGKYKEAVGHLNHMNDRQLEAFRIMLDKQAETKP